MTFLLGREGSSWMDLGIPLSVELKKDEDAPADSLSVSFPYSGEVPPFSQLRMYMDNAAAFDGIVDEQVLSIGASGRTLTLEARSRAALLLDNEALPQQYQRPSLPLLFQRHALPYGFSRAIGPQTVYSGVLSVTKGMSEWAVLSSFCENYLGVAPRITPQGELDATGREKTLAPLLFSSRGGIPYLSLEERHLPCNRLSEVRVRAQAGGEYAIRLTDGQAIAQGIQRRRYCNAAPFSSRPASFGEAMLRKAREQSYRLTISCPGWVDAQIGQACRVDSPLLPDPGDLLVCSVRYRRNASSHTTSITLRKKEG